MSKSPHVCKYWQPSRAGWRGHRWCDWCGRRQVKVRRRGEMAWENEIHLGGFADRWCPATSGTAPDRMLKVDVAFPFEWNCYESWRLVYRVTFVLPIPQREGLMTRTHVMNGWQSKWHEHWNAIDATAEDYYHERTGRWYDIGDNTYAEMRAVIQSPTAAPPQPSPLSLVPHPPSAS